MQLLKPVARALALVLGVMASTGVSAQTSAPASKQLSGGAKKMTKDDLDRANRTAKPAERLVSGTPSPNGVGQGGNDDRPPEIASGSGGGPVPKFGNQESD